MLLKDMPKKVVEKARKRLKNGRTRHRKYWFAAPKLPRKPEAKQVLRRDIPSVGEGKATVLIKRLEQAVAAAKKKGAVDVLVEHPRIIVSAYRPENEKEFQRRYNATLLDRAEYLLWKEQDAAKTAATKKARTATERLEAMQQLQQAVRALGLPESKKIIDGLVNGATK